MNPLPEAPSVLPSPALDPTNSSLNLQELQGIDHEASAALLMLNQDRRGMTDSIVQFNMSTSLLQKPTEEETRPDARRRGMSVRDLLIS